MARMERTPADFARAFLDWLAAEHPVCAGHYINASDIADLMPRFRAAAGCPYLRPGSLLRALGKVTAKRERPFMDRRGARSSVTEYLVPTTRKARERKTAA